MKRVMIVFIGTMLLWSCGQAAADMMPTDNLQLWLKADAINGLNNNDPVSTWVDSSVNGRNATQSGAARPTYITSALNGKPVIRFDGSVDYMAVADNDVWTFSNFDMFIVVGIGNLSKTMAFAASDEGGGDQNKWIWAYNPSYTSQTWHLNNSEGDHISLFGTVWAPDNSQYYVLELQKNASDYVFYEDGNASATGNSSLVIPNANAPLTIGSAEGNFFLQGDIAEMVIYNAALDDAGRNQVGSYLGDKYGLSVSYVPEPSTMVLVSLGGLAFLFVSAAEFRKLIATGNLGKSSS